MQAATVRDLKVSTDQFASVSEEASLRDAFLALQTCFEEDPSGASRSRDPALLVLAPEKRIVGRLTPGDILRGLETEVISHTDPLSMADGLDNWDRPLVHVATKARYLKVRNVLRPLAESDFIDEDAGLDQALRQLIDHHRSCLIVVHQGKTRGVLMLVDVFSQVCGIVKEMPQ